MRREGDRHIEFNFKPISDGGILGVFRDITELRQREEALAAAKEDVEQTRALMQTILDNMNDGVTLWDKDFAWRFSNRVHIERQRYTPEMLRAGVTSGYDMIRFQAERGEYGPLAPAEIDKKVQDIAAIIRDPKGGRYERRTRSGRYIEFSYNPLSDGSLLGVYRDITELKEREQALADAKEDIERTRAVMQTILDNMNDGVLLLDRDFSILFGNNQFKQSLLLPPDVAQPGNSGEEIIRFQAKRGDFGPTDDPDGVVRRRRAMMLTPGGVRFDRKTVSGRHIEFQLQAAGRRRSARRAPRHQRPQGARRRAGFGARGDAVGARQHERRRDAVRRGFPLQVRQSAIAAFPAVASRGRAGRHDAARYPALPGQARRLRTAGRRRGAGARAF